MPLPRRPFAPALTGILALLVPLAYASPPDPTWIPGLYDNADYDDVVGLVTDGTGASSSQAPARVERGLVAFAPLSEPGPVPHRTPRAQISRGPAVEACDASVNLQPNPVPLRSGIFCEAYWSSHSSDLPHRLSRNRVSLTLLASLLQGAVRHATRRIL